MPTSADALHQRLVDDHFDARARYWRDLYTERTLFGVIHQMRRDMALAWIESLRMAPGAAALDVGCGAGGFAVDLARRGLRVTAVDHSASMVALARDQVTAMGVAASVSVGTADAHHLPFADGSFDLAVALGVIPFMHSPRVALAELARVIQPGGRVLFTSDNRHRLNHLLDPRFTPLLAPLKGAVKAAAAELGHPARGVPGHKSSLTELKRSLARAGLVATRITTLGFGPYSFLGWEPLPQEVSVRLHLHLQRLADAGAPVLRGVGAQHLVLARRVSQAGAGAASSG